jgi:polar amino acid transport system ATP-binding protein
MTTNKTTKTAFLQIKNFTKSFGETKVLKGVDLDINKGEVVSIIGSSGSGKTTLLRCVNFLEKVDDGIMVLDGETLINGGANEKEDVLRKKRLNFGLVFQSFNLFPQYNVLQNITLAPLTLLNEKIKNYKLSLKGLSFKEKREKIKLFKQENINQINEKCLALLETIGLTDKKNAYPCELSGGQCQRVAIARALALEPKVLCFDEPTSALDPELTGEVLRVIKELKNKDRTMIIVTHEMGFAKNVSDKIVFMSDGVIEEVGTPKQVVENPKSEKLKHFLQSVSSKDGE